MPTASPQTGKIAEAVHLLDEARRTRRPIDNPPPELEPIDDAEAWAMHEGVVATLGPVVAWKVGAPTPEATPGFGAITADTLFDGGHTFPADAFRVGGVEAEIAVRFGRDLGARDAPYTVDEVLGAVATWHAAIEVLDSRFAQWPDVPKLWKVADRQNHGALVLGKGTATPPKPTLDRQNVRLSVDGVTAFEHEGGNAGGDPTRLLVWLANHLRGGARPLRAGDVVTTGSATPFLAARPGQHVEVAFQGLGTAELTIAP